MNTQHLADGGYCVISNRYMMVSRIDREDWKEYMAIQHCPWDIEEGLCWVYSLKDAANHYRRVYSNDRIEFSCLGRHMFTCFLNSSDSAAPSEYLELKCQKDMIQ